MVARPIFREEASVLCLLALQQKIQYSSHRSTLSIGRLWAVIAQLTSRSVISMVVVTALTIIPLRMLCTEQYTKSGIIVLHIRA